MVTKIEICNNVQSLLGQKPNIENIDQPRNEEERFYARWFDRLYKKSIIKYKPSCCEKRIKLTQDQTYVPEWGFSSGYKVPSTLLQLLEIEGDAWVEDKNPIEGGYILTNIEIGTIDAPAESLNVRILNYNTPETCDDSFIELVEKEIAKVAVYTLIKDTNERMSVIGMLKLDSYDFANKESSESGIEVINGSNMFGIQWSNRK